MENQEVMVVYSWTAKEGKSEELKGQKQNDVRECKIEINIEKEENRNTGKWHDYT